MTAISFLPGVAFSFCASLLLFKNAHFSEAEHNKVVASDIFISVV